MNKLKDHFSIVIEDREYNIKAIKSGNRYFINISYNYNNNDNVICRTILIPNDSDRIFKNNKEKDLPYIKSAVAGILNFWDGTDRKNFENSKKLY